MDRMTFDALLPQEQSELQQHEMVIDAGIKTFITVGNALLAIREKRLYRAEYRTFEEYCQERWGMAQSTAYRYLDAAKVVQNIKSSPIGELLPANEAQARPLTTLPDEKQAEAWQEAVETAPQGKVTAKHVEAVVQRYQEPPKSEAAIIAEYEASKQAEREAKRAEREAMIAAQRKAIETQAVAQPTGVFDVIVIDPPWAYGREYDPDTSRVANPYPEMPQEQLMEIKLPASDDAVLFLWTTHAFLWDAKELLDHWNFTYKATLVWDKEYIGMGAWVRMQCEFCLVGIKGKPFWSNTTWRDIIREPRREHSRKPDVFYTMVEDITAGRRLDYFSREQRDGWEHYGNDTQKF